MCITLSKCNLMVSCVHIGLQKAIIIVDDALLFAIMLQLCLCLFLFTKFGRFGFVIVSTVTCQKIWSLLHTPAINLIITCMLNFAHVPFHSSIHFLPLLVLHPTLWRGSSLPWLGGYWWGTIQHRFPVNARADRDEQWFMHIHTCGNFGVASSYICIFLGCGRKKKNFRREGNSTAKGPSWSETHNPPTARWLYIPLRCYCTKFILMIKTAWTAFKFDVTPTSKGMHRLKWSAQQVVFHLWACMWRACI